MYCLQLYIPFKVQTINLEWNLIFQMVTLGDKLHLGFPRLNNCNCGPKEIKQL